MLVSIVFSFNWYTLSVTIGVVFLLLLLTMRLICRLLTLRGAPHLGGL
jgi:hypothetical protein